jgi:hypothetical protein
METLYAVAILKTLLETYTAAVVAELEQEQVPHLIMQHPHHRSLGNVVTTGQRPGTISRGSFYCTHSVFFHISAPAEFVVLGRKRCPEKWLSSLRIHFSVQTCRGCTVTLFSSIQKYSEPFIDT